MKKVLFLIPNLMHGGAEKVLVNLVNNMNHEEFDVTVMTLFDVGVNKQFLSSQIHYKTIFKKQFRGNTVFFKLFKPEKLYKKYIKEKYDILVAYLEGSCTRIVGGCKNPEIVKIAWRHFAENKKEFLQAYRSMDEAKDIYLQYDQVVGVSQTVIDSFEELTGMKNISVVKYNTNETDKILKLCKEKVNNPSFQVDGVMSLVGVAKVRPRKGFMRLAEAHKRLTDEGYTGYKIFVLGEGEERGKIEKYLAQHNLQDSFVFLGYDTNPYKYVEKCDWFICPSFEEGFSTAATEALVVGTPVVTTLCSGFKEMLGENDEYGIIVENSSEGVYQGLKKVLDHPELLDYYSKQAKIRGSKFSMKDTVDAVEAMFIELMEKK